MLFKLPCHKNNPIKITLKSGEVILARITRFYDSTGKVCWIDKSEKWKGTTHCSRVVKASPEEVLEWSKKHSATIAPTHPIMAKWSLGKEMKGPQMMEGYYFSSVLFLNGVNVGKVADEGNGGCMVIMPNAKGYELKVAHQFMEDSKAWCIANGKTDNGDFEDFYSWWHDGRPNGKDAKTYLAEKDAEMQKWLAGVKPIHTGNLALVEGKI